MSIVRQDAWTQDEDMILAEVVLRHIREGSTQLKAFEEIGIRLNRTAAACGFRWNSLIRKQYESAIKIAKDQRKQLKKGSEKEQIDQSSSSLDQHLEIEAKQEDNLSDKNERLSMDAVIHYLNDLKPVTENYVRIIEENERLKNDLESLGVEHEQLKMEYVRIKEEFESMNEDYKVLMKIMNRARKMVIFPEQDQQSLKFKMDKNGNLQKIE